MFTGDIYIRGKYATYLKYLSQKTEKNDKKETAAQAIPAKTSTKRLEPVPSTCRAHPRAAWRRSRDVS